MKTSPRVREIGEKLQNLARLHDQYSTFKERIDNAVNTGNPVFHDPKHRTDKTIAISMHERWVNGTGGFELWTELDAEDTKFAMLLFQRHVNRTLSGIDDELGKLTAELETLKGQ